MAQSKFVSQHLLRCVVKRKSGACSAHFVVPRNFFNSGSISMMFFLRKGVLRGFKHPNTPVAVGLTEL
jgi:hypothetical protein